jgi:hypothetical protein
MKGPSGSDRYFPKNYSDSATIKLEDLVHYGQFIQSGSSKTLTIPSPISTLVGREIEFINTGSGNLTVACTSGFVAAVNNYTVATKTSLVLECVQTVPGTYKWNIPGTAGTTYPAETTTTVGALIAGATAKATPIDADIVGYADTESSPANLLKKATWTNIKAFLKTYFDTQYPAETVTTTAAMINGATAKGTPIDADIVGFVDTEPGTNLIKKVTFTQLKAFLKTYLDTLYNPVVVAAAFTPTLAWTTATPEGMTIVGRQVTKGKEVTARLYISSADPGNGGGKLNTITMPAGLIPADVNMLVPVTGFHRKDVGAADTWTDMQGWIDALDNTEGNRIIAMKNAVVWADNEVTELMLQWSYEIA